MCCRILLFGCALLSFSQAQEIRYQCIGEYFWLRMPCVMQYMVGLHVVADHRDSVQVYLNHYRAFVKDSCGNSQTIAATGRTQIRLEGEGVWQDGRYQIDKGKSVYVIPKREAEDCPVSHILRNNSLKQHNKDGLYAVEVQILADGPFVVVPSTLSVGIYEVRIGCVWCGVDVLVEDHASRAAELVFVIEVLP